MPSPGDRMVQAASANVNRLQHAVAKMEKTDSRRLQAEYTNLVEGLSSSFVAWSAIVRLLPP